jgi:hypothetical protein
MPKVMSDMIKINMKMMQGMQQRVQRRILDGCRNSGHVN